MARSIGTNSRIDPKFFQSSPGFGGSYFQMRIYDLVYLCRHFGLLDVADYWESVVALNIWQQHRFSSVLLMEGVQLAIHDPKVACQQMSRDLQQDAALQADALSGTAIGL